MFKNINFEIEEVVPDWLDDYDESKFAICKTCFLSTKKNSHELNISSEVLERDASTILGTFLVAKLQDGDATTHLPSEQVFGYFPKEQKIEFVEDGNVLKAYAYAVISKQYGKDFNEIFSEQNFRNTSVEMRVSVDEENEHKVLGFNIEGLCCLGTKVRGSCPDANMSIIRFSEEDAETFFAQTPRDGLSQLKNFVKERKLQMEEKYVNHPINTSKEALYGGDWDGEQVKQDLIKEEKFETLVPKVCLKLEEGWKDREVTKLGYPVMMLHEGEWVYSRKGLASALGYAKQHGESDVVDKVEAIYKDLDLELDGKEEDAKMSEIEFAAVNIGDMWCKLWKAIRERREWDYDVEAIYEEDNQKFALLRNEDGEHYRLDFSLTKEGLTIADEITKVEIEIVETDEIRKFAEPENMEELKAQFAEESKIEDEPNTEDVEMSADEMKAKLAEYEATIAEKENIIMEKDALIKELQEFKDARLEADKVNQVETVMSSVAQFMDKETADSYRQEGMSCEFAEIDAWSNKVKASVVDKVTKSGKKDEGFTRMSAPVATDKKKSDNVWDRI